MALPREITIEMKGKTGFIAGTLTLAVLSLVVPSLALSALGYASGGPLAGLGALGLMIAALSLGFRVAAIASVVTGSAAILVSIAASNNVLAVIAMVAVAAGFGLTARFSGHSPLILLPITLSFLVTENPEAKSWVGSIVVGAAIVVCGVAVSGLARLLCRWTSMAPVTAPHVLSWGRVSVYVALLSVATLVTASIAIFNQWGHTGGWLIMTPFIVMQPYVHDGWVKSLNRAAGTVAGFVIAIAVGSFINAPLWLYVIGAAFALGSVYMKVTNRIYALYVLFLTPAIVILESVGQSVTRTAENRLAATLIGVLVALACMAIVAAIGRGQRAR